MIPSINATGSMLTAISTIVTVFLSQKALSQDENCVYFLQWCMTAGKEQLPQSYSVSIRPPASTLLKHYIQTAAKSYTTLPMELSQPVIALSWLCFSFISLLLCTLGSCPGKTHKHIHVCTFSAHTHAQIQYIYIK